MYGWISLSIPCSTSVTSMIASTALLWCGSANLGPRKATMPSICAAQITPLFWAWEMESSRKSLNPTSALGFWWAFAILHILQVDLSINLVASCSWWDAFCGFWSEITIRHCDVLTLKFHLSALTLVPIIIQDPTSAFWMQLIWMCRLKDLREWSRGKKNGTRIILFSSATLSDPWVGRLPRSDLRNFIKWIKWSINGNTSTKNNQHHSTSKTS